MSEENPRISKDEYFMKIAEVVSQRSTCVKRKVGAVLIKDSHIISTGYNGVPPGFKHCTPESCVRKNLKSGENPELCRGVHAEINCVSNDSLLVLSDGRIVEANDVNDEIIAINKDLKSVASKAFKFDNIKENLIKIKTHGNFEIKVSSDHQMIIMDDNNGLCTKNANQLTINDYLPIVTKMNIKGKPQTLTSVAYDSYKLSKEGIIKLKQIMNNQNLSQNKLANLIDMSRIVIQRLLNGEGTRKKNILNIMKIIDYDLTDFLIGVERKEIKIPKITSPQLCQIIGYFIGDGSLGLNLINFYDKNCAILKFYNNQIEKVFGISGIVSKNKYENQFILSVSSKRLSLFFKKLKIGVGEKRIPELFQKLEKKSLSALLRGLFDAEGMVRISHKEVALTSGFKRILEVVRLLLLRYGILSSIYSLKRKSKISKGAGDYCYILSITGNDIDTFNKEISFSHPVKKKKLDQINSYGYSKLRKFPKKYFKCRIPTTNFPTLRNLKYRMITYEKAEEILSNLKTMKLDKAKYLEIKKLVKSDITFIKIKEIKKLKKREEMVDFHVPIFNCFVANGILTHNCIIQAAIHGTSIKGDTTLYTTTFPCMSCLKLIINAGIKKVVYKEGYNMENKVKADLLKESNLIVDKFC